MVILSLTHCNNHVTSANDEALRPQYGFLTLINRLCVAMSQQRELLIVANDEKMVEEIRMEWQVWRPCADSLIEQEQLWARLASRVSSISAFHGGPKVLTTIRFAYPSSPVLRSA